MSAASGKKGSVSVNGVNIADIVAWTRRTSSADKPYNSSSTYSATSGAGETRRVFGNNDSSGTFRCLSSNGQSPVQKGVIVALSLYPDFSTTPYAGQAAILDVSVAVNIETGDIIGVDVTWAQDGIWTEPSYVN